MLRPMPLDALVPPNHTNPISSPLTYPPEMPRIMWLPTRVSAQMSSPSVRCSSQRGNGGEGSVKQQLLPPVPSIPPAIPDASAQLLPNTRTSMMSTAKLPLPVALSAAM